MSLILLLIPSNGPLVRLEYVIVFSMKAANRLKVLMTGRNLGHTSERWIEKSLWLNSLFDFLLIIFLAHERSDMY